MKTRRWRACLGLCALLITGVAFAAAPDAEAQETAKTNAKITLDLREVPFRSAIEVLFERTGLQYAVETATPNTPVTLSLRDVDFTTALRTLTRLVGATYREETPIYIIGPRTAQAPPAQPVADPLALAAPALPARGEQTWEKIPILYNSVAVIAYALGAPILPTEDQLQRGGYGGYGGFGGYGGYGGGGYGGVGLNTFGVNGGLGGYGGAIGLGGGGFGGYSGYGVQGGLVGGTTGNGGLSIYGSGQNGSVSINTGTPGSTGLLIRARF